MKPLITIIGVVMIALTVINFQCNDNIVEPPPGHPPGYQEDIPWPPLADSPWSMIHGNPQLNGRATTIGPKLGVLDWQTEFETTEPLGDTFLSPVLRDSTVYFVSYKDVGENASHLYALNINSGIIEWSFPLESDKNTSPPITVTSNTIYVADWNSNLYAVSKSGEQLWKVVLPSPIRSSMNIGKDGTLYGFAGNGVVYAIKDGAILWGTDLADDFGSSSSAIVFAPDGKTMYITGKKLTALTTEGIIKWTLKDSTWRATWGPLPIVDAEGNIYLGGGTIKVNSDGTEISILGDENITPFDIDPAIDKNGNIYMGLITGEIASFNYKGELNWVKQFNIADYTSIICDKNSNIFFISDGSYINSIDSNGNLLWQYNFDGKSYYSPAIGDGKLFFGSVSSNGKYFNSIK